MGFMDLSTSVASRKHVDFNDARYQMAEKLKQSGRQGVRNTFTLYDSRETNRTSINDISMAYALSDKRLPMGELLNKMVDLIVDLEDGVLDANFSASYVWKYANALISMYEDKKSHQESLSVFDNGLKNAVINSVAFVEKYPGKYTHRTNFFDQKIKSMLEDDVLCVLKEYAIPKIHELAMKQSRELAEKHSNVIMDKIVQWAASKYNCTVDSFYEIKEDPTTHLFYSVNTVILHLANGYDMSIVGYVGTDHDDKFSISLFDALNISIAQHGEKMSQDELQQILAKASERETIDPLVKLCELEKKKNEILQQCYDILVNTRPMVPSHALELKAAESVVGIDYIWGCKKFRETHEDLPYDFQLTDLVLPAFDEMKARADYDEYRALVADVDDTCEQKDSAASSDDLAAAGHVNADSKNESVNNEQTLPTMERNTDLVAAALEDDMFGDNDGDDSSGAWNPNYRSPKKQFGSGEDGAQMPNLPSDIRAAQKLFDEHDQYEKYDASMTLLPGVSNKQADDKSDAAPVTGQAQAKPSNEPQEPTIQWKEPEKVVNSTKAQQNTEPKKTEPKKSVKQPALLIDDFDSLFA